MWTPRLAGTARRKYLGIVEALEDDIRAGRVAQGERLPPQRAIAEALQVDLTTVTRAFNEARNRGLVAAQPGRGTFIRGGLGDDRGDTGRGQLDLSMNIPSQPADVAFDKLIPEGIADLLGGARGLMNLHYRPSAGAEPEREAGATWLGSRIEGATPEQTIVTAGAQSALYAVCELLLRPGDTLAAGAMTYPGLKAIALQKGLALTPLEMDEDGIRPEAFETLCRKSAPRALYLTPSIDNPTTATLPDARRRQLAETARNHGVALIEDDPYAPLRSTGTVALADLAPEITWHIATLSKCATPALRVAYVLAPTAVLADRLAGVLRSTVLMAPPLMSALAGRWIADGTLDQITASIRAENASRQQLARTILADLDFAADPHGHHLWLRLPEPWRASDFAGYAERAGISIVPSSAFATCPHPEEAVRLSLGVARDRSDLEDVLLRLVDLILQPSPGATFVV
ncbi:aminotransferase-like domain-containing protein [Amorphus orientalis]|uniref:DNA-binding transcriptional MocR family regulator n=1 Tax=Amorphus orientalis TaxID=649198 RepID=A0AAE3VPA0_9HYPH|nr:PLP-dependent aminotransferase family protein [Amorphus orientalis]MDQ0315706.1 DNA-binding transcriptional MocR family regulator [Amorphus orientalis]